MNLIAILVNIVWVINTVYKVITRKSLLCSYKVSSKNDLTPRCLFSHDNIFTFLWCVISDKVTHYIWANKTYKKVV